MVSTVSMVPLSMGSAMSIRRFQSEGRMSSVADPADRVAHCTTSTSAVADESWGHIREDRRRQVSSDVQSLGLRSGLASRGMGVPDAVAVISFDGMNAGKHAVPPLTSIAEPQRWPIGVSLLVEASLHGGAPDAADHARHRPLLRVCVTVSYSLAATRLARDSRAAAHEVSPAAGLRWRSGAG